MDEIKLKEAVASLAKDQTQRKALAELIVEWGQPGHLVTDMIGLLMNTRALKPGDSLVHRVRKFNGKVLTHVPGAIPLKSEITISERVNHILDEAIISVQANEWELASGELGTVQSIKSEMNARLRDFYFNKVFSALSTIWTAANTPDNYVAVGGALTSPVLKTAIDKINQTTTGAKAIIGNRATLTPITTFGGFWSDGTDLWPNNPNLQEIMATGWLGRFYGTPVVVMPQVYDFPDTYNTMVPVDKVLIIGENVGEFITYGNVMPQEWTDMRPVPPYWNFSLWQQFGFIIDNAMGIYVIDDLT